MTGKTRGFRLLTQIGGYLAIGLIGAAAALLIGYVANAKVDLDLVDAPLSILSGLNAVVDAHM